MKVGDLVRVKGDDTCYSGEWCGCWFCTHNSTRIGLVIKKHGIDTGPLTVVAAHDPPGGYWTVLFDVGEWRQYGLELEVLN